MIEDRGRKRTAQDNYIFCINKRSLVRRYIFWAGKLCVIANTNLTFASNTSPGRNFPNCKNHIRVRWLTWLLVIVEIFSLSTRLINFFPIHLKQDGHQHLRFSLFFKTQLTREAKLEKEKKNVPACLPGHLLKVKEGIDSSYRVELGAVLIICSKFARISINPGKRGFESIIRERKRERGIEKRWR